MRTDLYKEMYQLEANYWWHVAKRQLVKVLISNLKLKPHKTSLVDVGCGTGKFLEEMDKWANWEQLIGLDGADEALKFTRRRKAAQVKKADFEKRLPLADNSVDIITSLDVVEHIADDENLILEIGRILKPGGVVIITVPAHQWMWTYWDDILGHKRRHTRKSVSRLMKLANLETLKLSYFYSYLLPVALVFRFLKCKTGNAGKSDFVTLPEWLNQALIKMAQLETWIINYINIPIGLSVVCLAQKPKQRSRK